MKRRKFIRRCLFATSGLALISSAGRLFGSTPSVQHLVQRGDTLGEIALRYGSTVAAIRQANNLSNDRIIAGQTLEVPIVSGAVSQALTHTVQKGDTLSGIASRYGVPVAGIRAANGLTTDLIVVGQELIIPAEQGHTGSRKYLGPVLAATGRIRLNRGRWRHIVGHHSAVGRGNAEMYDAHHRNRMRMVNGLAYHFVIGNGTDSGDGEIEVGNRWVQQLQGGHVRNHQVNLSGIGICLVGNFEETRPTRAQMEAFIELVGWLKYDILGGRPAFAVHREIDRNHTVCPGRHFPTAAMHRRFG